MKQPSLRSSMAPGSQSLKLGQIPVCRATPSVKRMWKLPVTLSGALSSHMNDSDMKRSSPGFDCSPESAPLSISDRYSATVLLTGLNGMLPYGTLFLTSRICCSDADGMYLVWNSICVSGCRTVFLDAVFALLDRKNMKGTVPRLSVKTRTMHVLSL